MSNVVARNLSFLLAYQQKNVVANAVFVSRKASDWIPKEKVTHTGQKWEPDDYRLARFIGRPKHVNDNFAIDLIEEVPPKVCKEHVVWCDGGGGPIGHPKIYINLDKPGAHACGYCGLRFCLEPQH